MVTSDVNSVVTYGRKNTHDFLPCLMTFPFDALIEFLEFMP